MLEKPARRRAAQGLREGHGPPLRTMANVAAKRVGRHHPGGRRAGCPHPAGPRGGTNVSILKLPWCGGRERPPYVAGRTLRLTGNPCAAATSVGDDARIVPGALRRRKVPRADMESAPTAEGRAGGQLGNHIPPPRRKPCRGRFHIGPACGNSGFAGGPWPSLTNHGKRPGRIPRPASNIAVSKR